MVKFKKIVMAFLWAMYVLLSAHFFPVYNINVAIPALFLFAIGTWLLGTESALLNLLFTMLYHYFLWDYHGDLLTVFQAKAIGTFMPITVIFFVATLKKQRDATKQLSSRLDQIITERTSELNTLTEKLIGDDETLRQSLGQNIHDGLGQNLTGLLLYSNSLQEELSRNKCMNICHANDITDMIGHTLNLARKTARSLFPFKVREDISLGTALHELVSYYRETTSIYFEVQDTTSEETMSEAVVLQFYRIIHEIILNTAHFSNPSSIHINLGDIDGYHVLRAEVVSETSSRSVLNTVFVELIRYRAQLIEGRVTLETTPAEKIVFTCKAPVMKSSVRNNDKYDQ